MPGEKRLVLLDDFLLGKVGLVAENLARSHGKGDRHLVNSICQDILSLGLILGDWYQCTEAAAYLSLCSSDRY